MKYGQSFFLTIITPSVSKLRRECGGLLWYFHLFLDEKQILLVTRLLENCQHNHIQFNLKENRVNPIDSNIISKN